MALHGTYARLYEEQQGAAASGVPVTMETNRLQRVPLFARWRRRCWQRWRPSSRPSGSRMAT